MGERVLVRLQVGHESQLLPQGHPQQHTHKWTVFVRALPPARLTDRSFVSKVVFTLHPDFPDPIRTVKVPPFEVSETGYAGFSIPITITFSCHKKITIVYDMNLTMVPKDCNVIDQTMEVRDVPASFKELVRLYCPSKKDKKPSSSLSSSSTTPKPLPRPEPGPSRQSPLPPKRPREDKESPRRKDKTAEARRSSPPPRKKPREELKASEATSSTTPATVHPVEKKFVANKEVKAEEQSSSASSPSSSHSQPSEQRVEWIHRALSSLHSPELYEVARLLLRTPVAVLEGATLRFDLTRMDAEVSSRLHGLLSRDTS